MLMTQLANDFVAYPSWITRYYDDIKKVLEDLDLMGKEFISKDLGKDYCGATVGMLIRYGVLRKVGKTEGAPITIDVSETMDYLYEGKRFRAIPSHIYYGGGYKLEKEYDYRWSERRDITTDGELVRRYKVDHISIIPKVNVYRFPFGTREAFAQNIADNLVYRMLA